MIDSNIGPFQTSTYELRLEGVTLTGDISAVNVQIDAQSKTSGTETEFYREVSGSRSTTAFRTNPLSPANKQALDAYVKTPAFKQKHLDKYGVQPGKPYEAKTSQEVLAECQAHADWAEMEASVIVDGAKLRDLAEAKGIKVFKAVPNNGNNGNNGRGNG